jgi:type IV pilus assembly protein PilA
MPPRENVPGQGKLDSQDAGFTLIELLVVIIIIGILAAIAIPVYLNQRQRAYDTASKSDIRNLAQREEAYLVSAGVYGSFSDLASDQLTVTASRQVTLTITYNGGTGFCLTAKHALSPTYWYYDSLAGGLQPTGTSSCPISSSGTTGGSLTG